MKGLIKFLLIKNNTINHIFVFVFLSVLTFSGVNGQDHLKHENFRKTKDKNTEDLRKWKEPIDSIEKAKVAYKALILKRSEELSVKRQSITPMVRAASPASFNYYVSTSGSDENPGSESAPFASIQKAINTASSGMSIKVQPGTYYENLNFNGKSLQLYGSPENPELTKIDANSTGRAITMVSAESSSTVINGFTLTGGVASNASITPGHGGAIYLYSNAEPKLENLIICENEASAGGAVSARHNGNPDMKNCLIYNNEASVGGALYIYNESTIYMTNVTIGNNSTTNEDGGNIYLQRKGRVEMTNSIVWGSTMKYELVLSSATTYNENCTASVNYTDLRGGQSGKVYQGTSNYSLTVTWGTGSLNTDPLFTDATNNNFILQGTSQCIDAGNPSSEFYDVNFPPGQGSTRNDMGVFGGPEAWYAKANTIPEIESPVCSISGSSVIISWTAIPSIATGVRIERSINGEDFNSIANLDLLTTNYTDNNILDDNLYAYRLVAYNQDSETMSDVAYVSTSTFEADEAVAQFNGNISQVTWKTKDGDVEKFDYYYDALNRLTKAQYTNATTPKLNGAYTTENIKYDLNGNIEKLSRFSDVAQNPASPAVTEIDILQYNYIGNQLQTVEDAVSLNEGFIDKENTTDYDYDANGNMIKDRNKGISISYNYLNLPELITLANGDQVKYIYDAAGVKRAKEIYSDGNRISVTDYTGIGEYENGALNMIYTEQGRLTKTSTGFTYEYFIKDHLGNNRVLFTKNSNGDLDILQENHYYAFGGRLNKGNHNDNKYLFNGKELQEEIDWYDYGARMYDPAIARWHTLDNLAEEYISWSPYQYVMNNPLKFVDPDGNGAKITITGNQITITATVYLYSAGNTLNERTNSAMQNLGYNSNNGVYTVNTRSTVQLSRTDGLNIATEDFNVNYVLNVQVVDENEAKDLQNNNEDATSNFFEVMEDLPGEGNKGFGLPGENIGAIDIDALNDNSKNNASDQSNSGTEVLNEEVWHTAAGANYDNNSTHGTVLNKDGFPSNNIATGGTSGDKKVQKEDMKAIMKSARMSTIIRGNPKATAGQDANRFIKRDDIK